MVSNVTNRWFLFRRDGGRTSQKATLWSRLESLYNCWALTLNEGVRHDNSPKVKLYGGWNVGHKQRPLQVGRWDVGQTQNSKYTQSFSKRLFLSFYVVLADIWQIQDSRFFLSLQSYMYNFAGRLYYRHDKIIIIIIITRGKTEYTIRYIGQQG